jgi:hypothetical protein
MRTTPQPHGYPEPLGNDFIDLSNVLEENLPVLCTLLFGFEGLLFVTVATLDKMNVDIKNITFQYLIFWSALSSHSIEPRTFIMIFSGLSCSFLYLSVISVIYSRLSRYDSIISADVLTNYRQNNLYNKRLEEFDRRRSRLTNLSMLFFNLGITLLPISVLGFLYGWFRPWLFSVLVYLFVVVFLYSLYRQWEAARTR